MHGTCQGERVDLRKEIKELEMIEHVCSRKYGSTFHFMEPEQTKSKWCVIESLAVTGPKTSGDHRVDIPGKRDNQVYTPSLQLPPPGIRSMERNRTYRYTYEIGGRDFHLRKNPSSWEKGERI